jgi:hypothetical protein
MHHLNPEQFCTALLGTNPLIHGPMLDFEALLDVRP